MHSDDGDVTVTLFIAALSLTRDFGFLFYFFFANSATFWHRVFGNNGEKLHQLTGVSLTTLGTRADRTHTDTVADCRVLLSVGNNAKSPASR